MSALPYHKRYHSDALAGVMSLTMEERGGYQTLLDFAYQQRGPDVPERLAAGLCGVSMRKWRIIAQRLFESGHVIIEGETVKVLAYDVALLGCDSRIAIPGVVRALVIERCDRRCAYCGSEDGPMEIDHIVPLSRGGVDRIDNFTLACRPCNRSKGGKRLEDWLS